MLCAGSLADNIALIDPENDIDKVENATKLACIHDDVKAMPLGYDMLVGAWERRYRADKSDGY